MIGLVYYCKLIIEYAIQIISVNRHKNFSNFQGAYVSNTICSLNREGIVNRIANLGDQR
jgi:hypothetical protein